MKNTKKAKIMKKKYAAGAHNIMLQETVELVRQQGLKATGFTVDMSNK